MKHLLLALMLAHTCVNAQELWVTSGFVSKHLKAPDAGKTYNERNPGLGLEYSLSPTWAVSGGFYKNSWYRRSQYLQAVWTPAEFGPVKLGIAMGVVNGYPLVNKGGYFPTLLPVLSFGYVNLTYVPSVMENSGAVALQFKVQIR